MISTSFWVGGVHITMYLLVLFDCVLYLFFFFSFLGYTIHSLRPTTTKTNNNYISLVSNVSSVKRNTVLGIRARISQNKTETKKKNENKNEKQLQRRAPDRGAEEERRERSEIGEMCQRRAVCILWIEISCLGVWIGCLWCFVCSVQCDAYYTSKTHNTTMVISNPKHKNGL